MIRIRRFRFGLKTLLFVTTIAATILGVCTVIVKWHFTNQSDHEGRFAVSAIGGTYSLESAVQLQRTGKIPNFLWRKLFNRVYHIDLSADAWPRVQNPSGVRYVAITDAHLVLLRKFASLRELDLHDTDVSDRGIQHLQRLSDLKYLDISYTKISGEGAKTLRSTLPLCEIKH